MNGNGELMNRIDNWYYYDENANARFHIVIGILIKLLNYLFINERRQNTSNNALVPL